MTTDKITHKDRLHQNAHLAGHAIPPGQKESDAEEISCAAFGYLRGIKDRANAVEFRFKAGNSVWFPYSWLGPCKYDPSEGLLLKFSGDLVYVVLIRGSALDMPINEGHMNLTTGGLQRHRVIWIREMPEGDIKSIGETGPTIDSIEIAEFESHADPKGLAQQTRARRSQRDIAARSLLLQVCTFTLSRLTALGTKLFRSRLQAGKMGVNETAD